MRKIIMHNAKFIIGIVAMSLLSSCGLYKKYERPTDVEVKGIMRGAETADSLTFGDVDWHEVFTDPQLQNLIQQGLDNNDDMFAAAANVKKLEAALQAARLAFLPTVNFNPSGTLSKVLTGNRKGDWSKSYALPVSASWTFDLFGNILSQKRSAQMSLEMAKDNEQAVRSRLICSIANSYYTLLMLDRQLEILTEMEGISSNTLEMMKLQKELRGAKETSVMSAKSALLNIQANKVDMRRQISEVEASLSLLVDQPAQHIERGKLANQSLPTQFATGTELSLLRNRPDVHAAEMNLAACFYDVENARSKMYPTITISGTGSFTNDIGTIANPGQWLARFVGGLTQPIFQNGRLRAQLKVAKLSYEVAFREWEHQILHAGAEVSNALVEYNSSNEQSLIDRENVEVLTKAVDYTQQLYRMRSSTYLEVLTAQQQLLNAQIDQVSDDFNKMQAVVSLYSALGGGRK